MIDVTYITPIVIEITLYQNNLKDNQLISALKHSTDLFTLPEEPKILLVNKSEMENILANRFQEDIDNARLESDDTKYLSVNSPYFIDNLCKHFDGLQYFRIIISKKINYTRLVSMPEGNPIIDFRYRATYAKLDLTRVLDKKNLKAVKHLLEEAGILNKSKIHKSPYIQINITEMFNVFGNREDEQQYFSEYFDDAINTMLEVVGPKLERDNTNMLLILEP